MEDITGFNLGFRKIKNLTWTETGVWTADCKELETFLHALRYAYPNMKIKTTPVSDDIDNISDLIVYIKFKDEADEAEFIMREMS